jgi:hypothetical protein
VIDLQDTYCCRFVFGCDKRVRSMSAGKALRCPNCRSSREVLRLETYRRNRASPPGSHHTGRTGFCNACNIRLCRPQFGSFSIHHIARHSNSRDVQRGNWVCQSFTTAMLFLSSRSRCLLCNSSLSTAYCNLSFFCLSLLSSSNLASVNPEVWPVVPFFAAD